MRCVVGGYIWLRRNNTSDCCVLLYLGCWWVLVGCGITIACMTSIERRIVRREGGRMNAASRDGRRNWEGEGVAVTLFNVWGVSLQSA